MAEDRKFYEQQLQKPAIQNLLRTIRYAEGTERGGEESYRVMFSGKRAPGLAKHPDQAISSGGYTSTAAGAYQFLTPTWQSTAQKLGLKSFGPQEQDIGGLYLAHQRLKPIGGLARLEKEGLSPEVAAALSPEWASFPTKSGKSYYGQPVKSLKDLQKVYGQTIASAPQPSAPVATAPQQQAPGATIILVGDDEDDTPKNPLASAFLRDYTAGLGQTTSKYSPSKMTQGLLANMLSSIAGTQASPDYFGQRTA